MALLTEEDARQVREMFDSLTRDVHVTIYTQKLECPSCAQAELIIDELGSLSDRLVVEKLNPLTDEDRAREDGVESAPFVTVSDGRHSRVRFMGTPAGYEFSSLLTAIIDAGTDDDRLEPETLEFLRERLQQDLEIRIFVTTSCPHCPRAVVLAHRLALESDRVTATAIDAGEFGELSRRFMVQGVPRTVINDLFFVEGALPEGMLVQALEKALSAEEPAGPRNLLDYLDGAAGGGA
jgi:glutaredoxin-like protein